MSGSVGSACILERIISSVLNCLQVDEVDKTEGGNLGILIGSSDECFEREHPFHGFMRHMINYIDPQVCLYTSTLCTLILNSSYSSIVWS